MLSKRTDLAVEAKELFDESAGKTAELSGVRASDYVRDGFAVTSVEILDARGAASLGKPVGDYRTVSVGASRDAAVFSRAVSCIGKELATILPPLAPDAPVLVALLGNADITPDAVGPETAKNLFVTRHLRSSSQFASLRPVSAVCAGVLGSTGIESAEIIGAAAGAVRPAAVVAVDAFVARSFTRLCRSVQLSDSGVVPGSGVGNHRRALTRESLGVPVIAVGVPTVIDAATMAADLLEESGAGDFEPRKLKPDGSLIVTTKDIDSEVRLFGRMLGYSISLALQPDLTETDLAALLA
jgi:spore protease